MQTKKIRRWACCLVGIGLALSVAPSLLDAQPRSQENQGAPRTIHEDDQPWSGTPWLVGTVLAGGAIAVAVKPAKRTHLD